MRAASSFRVERVGGVDRLVDVRCEPPLAVRRLGGPGLRLLIVGTAASPVGGDEIRLDASIGPGASVEVGSATGAMVWPGPPDPSGRPAASSVTTSIDLGSGAVLRWWPKPTVVVCAAHHRSSTTVSIAPGASLTMVEEVALGRTGEEPGTCELALRVEVEGRPLLHHVERIGPHVPGWGSAATCGTARHVVLGVLVGEHAAGGGSSQVGRAPAGADRAGVDRGAAWLPLAPALEVTAAVGAAAMVVAFGADRPAAMDALLAVAPRRLASVNDASER